MDDSCEEMITFVSWLGPFQFEVMSFGLMSVPETIQLMMDILLKGLHFCPAYFDGVIIYSKSLEERLLHLDAVSSLISKLRLRLTVSKSEFVMSEVQLLGHAMSANGVAVNPRQVQ